MKRITHLLLVLVLGASSLLRAGSKLTDAAARADIPKIKASLQAGEKINDTDKYGWTALMWAVFYRWDTTARWLLAHGADPNVVSTRKCSPFPAGSTALGIAVYYERDTLVELLMTVKADPNVLDAKGKSPLNYAQEFKFESCVAAIRKGPAVNPAVHSFANLVIKEGLDDLLVVIDTDIPKSMIFLQDIQNELAAELKGHKVRQLVCLANPLNPEAEKEIRLQGEAFKPRYILQWHEISATVANVTDRHKSKYKLTLKRSGDADPVWQKDFYEGDSHFPIGYSGDAYKQCVRSAVDELEANLLLRLEASLLK